MSSPHPTISAWERDAHDGQYRAELHGWQLRVSWTPNKGDKRGSFHWLAQQGEASHHADHHFEEMELAMADAEQFARQEADKATRKIAAATR